MKMQSVVVSLVYQIQKISSGDRHGVGKQFNGDVTLACLHQYLRSSHNLRRAPEVFESVQYSFTIERLGDVESRGKSERQ